MSPRRSSPPPRAPVPRAAAAARLATALAALLTAACASPGGGVPAAPVAEPDPVEAGRVDPPGRYRQGTDVLHYDLELALPESSGRIVGRALLTVRWSEPPGPALVLDLTGLAVEEVRVDGRPAEASLMGDRLTVALPTGLAQGDTSTVEVRYQGTPDDGLILGRTIHGRPSAFADNWPNRARFWFPSVDHPSDKATARFTVHAPARFEVIANGALTAAPAPTAAGTRVPDAAARRTWRWETRTPIPTYTMVVGAAEMVVRSVGLAACGRSPASTRPDGCVEVSWWAFPPDTAHAATVFARAASMVDFFTEYVGDFPYEKLANVQSSTRFGGMENASAIFYSERGLAERRDIEGTVSHEIAHQWFGDAVTERDWTHLWLSEGFATYFGALFFERADGAPEFRRRMEGARQTYLGSDVVGRPVIDPDAPDLFALLNANNYQKGAWVLHMLRGLVGEAAFQRTVREYYRRHLHRTALTPDLQAIAEEVSGMELGWFFRQWLTQPGHPVLSVERSWDPGSDAVTVTVRQLQDASWPRFHIPIEIELAWEGGSRRERVELDGPESTFVFSIPAPPTAIELDPDGWVLAETLERGEQRDAPR